MVGQPEVGVDVQRLLECVAVADVAGDLAHQRRSLHLRLVGQVAGQPRTRRRVADLDEAGDRGGERSHPGERRQPPHGGRACGKARTGARGARGRTRQAGEGGERKRRLVAAVAAVGLVGALPGQHDLHLLAREGGELQQNRRRRYPAGLLEVADGAVDPVAHALGAEGGGAVAGAEQRGCACGGSALVEPRPCPGEADREGARRLAATGGDRGDDRCRVDTAAEQRPHRHVGHQLPFDGVEEAVAQLGRELVVVEILEVRGRWSAVARDARRSAHRRDQQRRRRQFADAGEERARGRYEAPGEEVVERDRVDAVGVHAGSEQRAHLGRCSDAATVAPPVERFDAERVARQHQPSGVTVPEREREDAVEALEDRRAPLFVAVHDDFAVGGGRETVTVLFERFA
ncbi:hypothetical protein HRbin41_01389 [bacterium HR41]|nr:hypothetical protein HRbin41_01389 [bacterium HR41]